MATNEELEEIKGYFENKKIKKQIRLFRPEFEEIIRVYYSMFDIPKENLKQLNSFSLKAFSKKDLLEDDTLGGYCLFYPVNEKGKMVNTSKVSLNQYDYFSEEEISLEDLNIFGEIHGEKEEGIPYTTAMKKALVHEAGHFLSRKDVEIISKKGKDLKSKDINTKKARRANILTSFGGIDMQRSVCDKHGKVLAENSKDEQKRQRRIRNEIINGIVSENSIFMKQFFNYREFDLKPTNKVKFFKMPNESEVMLHEGMTEMFALKLIENANLSFLNKKDLPKLEKAYLKETAYAKMLYALNGKKLEDMYFYGNEKKKEVFLYSRFLKDFDEIMQNFEIMFENVEDKIFEKEGLTEFQCFKDEFNEFLIYTSDILKKQKEEVEERFKGGEITKDQLRNYNLALKEFVSPSLWNEECYDYVTIGEEQEEVSSMILENLGDLTKDKELSVNEFTF